MKGTSLLDAEVHVGGEVQGRRRGERSRLIFCFSDSVSTLAGDCRSGDAGGGELPGCISLAADAAFAAGLHLPALRSDSHPSDDEKIRKASVDERGRSGYRCAATALASFASHRCRRWRPIPVSPTMR